MKTWKTPYKPVLGNRGVIALDTNVLVRFLTQDDAEQGALASDAMSRLSRETPGFVCREVLVELVWVLERAYKYPRAEIAKTIEELLSASELVVEAAEDVGCILQLYENDGFGFSDLMILQAGVQSGAKTLLTLDRKAAQLEGATLLDQSVLQ